MRRFLHASIIFETLAADRWNTAKGNKVSNFFRGVNYIEHSAAPKENNAEKIAKRMKMRMRRSLINRASSLFLRTKRASSMMEKCARQHISEVVPLSSWSLKKNRAFAVRARNAPKNLKKFEQSYRKEVSVNGQEVKSFAWHALSLSYSLGTNYVNSVRYRSYCGNENGRSLGELYPEALRR